DSRAAWSCSTRSCERAFSNRSIAVLVIDTVPAQPLAVRTVGRARRDGEDDHRNGCREGTSAARGRLARSVSDQADSTAFDADRPLPVLASPTRALERPRQLPLA